MKRRAWSRVFIQLAGFALLLTLSGSAAGAPSASTPAAQARALFAQAQAEYNLGHFDKALALYEGAYKIKAVPTLLFNIAQCHRQLADMRGAATTYKAYLRTARDGDPNRVKAQALLAEVEDALAKQVQAQEARPLGSVSNGEETGKSSETAARDHDAPPELEPSIPASAEPEVAKDEVVAARGSTSSEGAKTGDAPAHGVAREAVEGATGSASSDGARSAPDAAVQTSLPPEGKSGSRTFTWVAAGGAVAALAAGALFGMKSKSGASDLETAHHSKKEIDTLQAEVSSNASKANLLFAVGGVMAAATGTFFVLRF